ncbi:MAG: MFS transporter [Desulfosalsimonas sp.]
MKIAITNRWGVFVLTSMFFLLSQFYRASMAVISSDLIGDLGLSASDLSLLSSSFFYAFALVQIPIGLSLDRFSPRVTMSVLSLFGVAGALCFAWAGSLSAALAGRILLGFGMACNLMGPFKLLTLWFGPAQFASLTTVIFSIGAAGSIVSSSPLAVLVEWVGWRWAFTFIAIFHVVLTAVFFLCVRDRPQQGQNAPSEPDMSELIKGLRILFGTRDYWIISIGTFCRYGVYAAIQTLWAGPYLIYGMGLSPVQAGNIILVLNVAFIIAGPLCGAFSDRIQLRKGVILAGFLGMGLTLVILSLQPSGASIPMLVVLFAAFGATGSTGGIMYTHIKERMPSYLAGTAMTGVNLFTMIGAAFFVHGLGFIMEKRYAAESLGLAAFRMSFLLCAACIGIVFILYLFTRENQKKANANDRQL